MFKNMVYMLKKNKRKVTVIVVSCFILIGLILIPFSFAELEPVKSVDIYSENANYKNSESGSWKIEKSAKWVSKGTAEVTFDVDTVSMMKNIGADIYLVFDTSGSMEGSKLDKVKEDSIALINDLFNSIGGNKVGLIRFSDNSQILSDLTTDKQLLEDNINDLKAEGETNYYNALVDIASLLENYEKQSNRDCIVLFLTDGLPNINTHNEVAEYKFLKSQYPWLIINGIYYEMGDVKLDPLVEVTDNQFVAEEETLNKALEEASVEKVNYKTFTIMDYIDTRYFSVESTDDISVNYGTVTLDKENQKITWNLADLRSGLKLNQPKMKIKIKLKNELLGTGGIYPTNDHEEIKTEIENKTENVNSPLTPILADNYKVEYDANEPDGCKAAGFPTEEKYSVFDTVDMSEKKPTCEGYKFKEWRVINTGVEKIGIDKFIMPEENVKVKAIWAELGVKKSMDGKLFKVQDLYEMIRDNARGNDQNINYANSDNLEGTSGVYQHYETKDEEYPVYYYRGIVDNNNILFANMCWKIVRTTETRAVKLLYNGTPDNNGSCNVNSYYTNIGYSQFNNSGNSLAYVGYKYGKAYLTNKITSVKWYELIGKSGNLQSDIGDTNYYYGDGVTYQDGVGYTLTNPEQKYWSDNYSKLNHHYTCLKGDDGVCEKVYFILSNVSEDGGSAYGPTSSNFYYVEMENGETYESLYSEAEKVTWNFGNDVTYSDGIYTLTNSVEIGALAYFKDYKERNKAGDAHHYTCFTNSDICNTTVDYVYYMESNDTEYIILQDGTNVEKALEEMTSASTNENKSAVLKVIDSWYEKNLKDTEFEQYIDDAIWCNDRSIGYMGSWDKNFYSGTSSLSFSSYFRNERKNDRPSLECPNEADRFSVGNQKAKLDYPVGMLTADEATLAGNGVKNYFKNSYLYGGTFYWLMSGSSFWRGSSVFGLGIMSSGALTSNYSVNSSSSVRPSIAIKSNAIIVSGDGSTDSPFIISYSGV